MSTLRRTLARVAAATALVGAAAALPAAPASAASTCTTDCLTAVSVTADTQKVRVNATTYGSTHTVAEVWKADKSVRLSSMSVTASGYWATSFSFASSSYLPQNTYYAVKVVATDMLGATRTEWLSVRVKQRIATYYISRIDLADDSDAAGAGEFRAGWKAGTTVKPAAVERRELEVVRRLLDLHLDQRQRRDHARRRERRPRRCSSSSPTTTATRATRAAPAPGRPPGARARTPAPTGPPPVPTLVAARDLRDHAVQALRRQELPRDVHRHRPRRHHGLLTRSGVVRRPQPPSTRRGLRRVRVGLASAHELVEHPVARLGAVGEPPAHLARARAGDRRPARRRRRERGAADRAGGRRHRDGRGRRRGRRSDPGTEAAGTLATELGAALWFGGVLTLGARSGATVGRAIGLAGLALGGALLVALAWFLAWEGAALALAMELGVGAVAVAVLDVLLLGLLYGGLTRIADTPESVVQVTVTRVPPFVRARMVPPTSGATGTPVGDGTDAP